MSCLERVVEANKFRMMKTAMPQCGRRSPYYGSSHWDVLEVRKAIDVMHLTKNLCVNLLGFLDAYGQSKDTLEARRDLKETNQREDLRPEKRKNGQHYIRPASYTLSKEEKESMFDCLNSVKGYSSNVQRRINMKEKKFINLKSQDYHILMTNCFRLH